LHSLVRNHALVDGNKRLALAGTIAFLGINGQQLRFSNDDAYDFVIAVATGELDQARATATVLERNRSPRGRQPLDDAAGLSRLCVRVR
jgi:death-on-curing protein